MDKTTKEILRLLADGWSYDDICRETGLGHSELSTMLAKLRTEYAAKNSVHLIAILVRKGVIK